MEDFLAHGKKAYEHTFGWLQPMQYPFQVFKQQLERNKVPQLNAEKDAKPNLKPCLEDFLLAAFDDCTLVRNNGILRRSIIRHLAKFYYCQDNLQFLHPLSDAFAAITKESGIGNFSRKQLEDVFEHALKNRRNLGRVLWWGDGLINMYDLYVGLHAVLDDPVNDFTQEVKYHNSKFLPPQRRFFTITRRYRGHKEIVDNPFELRALFESYLFAYQGHHKVTNSCISAFKCFLTAPQILEPSLIKIMINEAHQKAQNREEISDEDIFTITKDILDGPRWTFSTCVESFLSSGYIVLGLADFPDNLDSKPNE